MAKKIASAPAKHKKPATTITKVTTVEATKDTKSVTRSVKNFYKSLKRTPIIGAVLAELVGSFLLVATILTVQANPLYTAFGLIGIVLIVSGASVVHLNPAITIGAWVTRRINFIYAICYIMAQIIGAVLAWVVLSQFLKGDTSSSSDVFGSASNTLFTASELAKDKEWYIFFAELLGTTILATGIANSIKSIKGDKTQRAMTYAFTALVALIVAGSATAIYANGLTFINPVVAAAANALSWNIWPIAIYVFAPVIGGILGFALADIISTQDQE